MTYDLRRLRLKGLIFRPPRTNRYFVTPYGWKVARLFSRLEARVFRPAVAMFAGNDAVLPFPLRASLDRVDAQMDELIYEAFPRRRLPEKIENTTHSLRSDLRQTARLSGKPAIRLRGESGKCRRYGPAK